MTRQPHDQFAKQYLEELLSPLGKVEVSREVTDEVRQVDILFFPAPSPNADPQSLGLLGKIATSASLLEPYRNQPSKTEVRNCILKLFSFYGELQRKARRESTSLPEDDLPRLWILATSASEKLLDDFGAKLDLENWLPGIYFLAKALRTAVVAINQLPVTQETLLLRILGKGETQRQAVSELLALPKNNPIRQNVQQLLASWRITVVNQENLTEDDQELIMNLSQAYMEWREATLQEGQRLVVENLLRVRFGTVDAQLLGVVEALIQLPPQEYSRLLLELSREELLARFGSSSN
ncbi:hypothetical protein [Scytonema sp. PCC 10023]|uniref:hypothetical protein n=1 Tax=Scytonema sp. PCC 10023 TaxID=1680591 RepID=UPI0039C69E96